MTMKKYKPRFNEQAVKENSIGGHSEEVLEKIIDEYTLKSVLESIVDICYAKAEHLRANWQDERSAKFWEKDAVILDRIMGKISN